MSQFGINFIADEGDSCLTSPARECFHIGAIKHASRWITGSVHEQDAWVGSVAACLDHRLRKGLWSQAMMIVWLGLHVDYAPTDQVCHRSIADPRGSWQQDVAFENVQERIEQRFAPWTDNDLIRGTRYS